MTQPANVVRPDGIRVLETQMRGWRDLQSTLRAILAERPARVQLEYSGYGWSRWGFSFWLNALALRLRMAGAGFDVGFHEFALDFKPRPDLFALAVIQRLHMWLLAATATRVITNTAERVRVLRRWLPWNRDKVFYRPNSSTISVQPISTERKMAVRRERGAPPGATVVATFGMFHSGKNYEGLIQAAALAGRSANLRLWMLGDTSGVSMNYLKKLQETAAACNFADAVWWSARMTAEEISAHLQAADIFVLPQSDGHLTRSSAFMAAATHGVASVAVRNAENQQEFTHGENVWLVERSDATRISEAIAHLIANAGLRARLGESLRNLYREKFDWPQHSMAAAPESTVGDTEILARETLRR